ncbi:MAG: hypothetical protein CM1200mP33_7500 [Chloroflexota bacterium]|nr:MAG: hypothetical protein CM1200mP33_7500 [Chloroflexota bacterium]
MLFINVGGKNPTFPICKKGKRLKSQNQDTNIDYYKLAQLILAKENSINIKFSQIWE